MSSEPPVLDQIVLAPTEEEKASAAQDPKALQEAAAIEEGEYDKKDAKRKDELKGGIHAVAMWGLRLMAVLGGALVIVYVLHLVLPEHRRWLSPADVDRIQSLLVGTGAAAVARIFQFYQSK